MAIRARPPPPAVGVPVTRQRRAAAGPAHPAAAAPGQSRGEARRERRQVRPPGRKGRGLCQAGPSGRGGRVCVFWVAGVWVPEPAPVAVCALAPAVTEPEWALSQSRRCLWRSECTGLCACTRVFVWRGRRVCICVCSGPSLCRPAPAQSLLHGDVFQTGFLRRLALLQPELEGERRPHRPPGTRAAWGLQTDT